MSYVVGLAAASIFLYSLLAITCFYFALSFWDLKSGEFNGGRYGRPKFVFFVVLCVSAVLDIPLFIGCIVQGGPTDCEWNSPSYVVFWLFHLVATCGYVYAIITPAILWSDIIQHKDGNLWNTAYPLDSTKIFFRVAYVLFCANELTTVIGSTMYQDPNNQADYTKSNAVGAFSDCFTPIITTVVTVGCLWSGITLQRHVMSVGLGGTTQIKILMQLNFTMLLISVTYIMRSLLVLCLYDDMPYPYKHAFQPLRSSFLLWLIWTRWLPTVFCSFCLVNEMRFKGVGNANINHESTTRGSFLESLLKGFRMSGLSAKTRHNSADTHSTNDSALEQSYSMLNSVDFESGSDTSYVLSPQGSPERSRPKSVNSRDFDLSCSPRVGDLGHTLAAVAGEDGIPAGPGAGRTRDIPIGSRDAKNSSSTSGGKREKERGRALRKSLQQLQQPNPQVSVRSALHPPHNSHTAQSSGPGTPGVYNANYAQRAESGSGSDAEYKFDYPSYSPPRGSIDHFFTFAAPNLNLSNISNNRGNNGETVPPRPAHSALNTVNNTAMNSSNVYSNAYSGGSASHSVLSFSPPTYRSPDNVQQDFINQDERASPEVNSKSL